MSEKRFGAFSSSANPDELSVTVTSFVQMVVALAVGFGWMTATGADTLITQVPVLLAAGLATYNAVTMVCGAIRKVFYAIYPPTV